LAVVLRDHLTKNAIQVSNYLCCLGLGDGDVDLLVPASMTLLAVAGGIADHSDVASNQTPRAVTVEKLALAGDDHSMAGNHCHCPVQVDYPANGYGWIGRKTRCND